MWRHRGHERRAEVGSATKASDPERRKGREGGHAPSSEPAPWEHCVGVSSTRPSEESRVAQDDPGPRCECGPEVARPCAKRTHKRADPPSAAPPSIGAHTTQSARLGNGGGGGAGGPAPHGAAHRLRRASARSPPASGRSRRAWARAAQRGRRTDAGRVSRRMLARPECMIGVHAQSTCLECASRARGGAHMARPIGPSTPYPRRRLTPLTGRASGRDKSTTAKCDAPHGAYSRARYYPSPIRPFGTPGCRCALVENISSDGKRHDAPRAGAGRHASRVPASTARPSRPILLPGSPARTPP